MRLLRIFDIYLRLTDLGLQQLLEVYRKVLEAAPIVIPHLHMDFLEFLQ